jgi:sugar O-acyltransferase (sialic acid O-acetyltransferase NeuD family)
MLERELVILGAGGAGLEALMVARRAHASWRVRGFADDSVAPGTVLDGLPVLGSIADVLAGGAAGGLHFHCAIGRNTTRQKLALLFEKAGWTPATLLDPSAVIADSARVGEGSYVGPQAFVGPQAQVGRHVLINVGASVGHHVIVGDFAQICPGARLSGTVTFGPLCFIGSNGVVAPGVRVGEAATIGASSFAAREVPAGATAVGVPAKVLAVPARPPEIFRL